MKKFTFRQKTKTWFLHPKYHIFFCSPIVLQNSSFDRASECTFPNLLRRIKMAIASEEVKLYPPFISHLVNHGNSSDPADINFDFIIQPRFTFNNNNNLQQLNNNQIRYAINPKERPPFLYASPKDLNTFIKSRMYPSPRNVWFRMIQDKLITRQKLIRDSRKVDDDLCQLCFHKETSEHMIITCPYKKDIWIKLLKAFIASPNNPRLHQLYHDMLTLDFTCYTLLKLDLHCSIFDIISTTIRFAWRSHWQFMFEGIPIDEYNIFDNICKELCKISSYQSSS
jgi:hypothetical protein